MLGLRRNAAGINSDCSWPNTKRSRCVDMLCDGFRRQQAPSPCLLSARELVGLCFISRGSAVHLLCSTQETFLQADDQDKAGYQPD
jgi:hypothetical protein